MYSSYKGRDWLVQVPLQAVDLSHVSILYTQGDMAAITPIYDYNFQAGLSMHPHLVLGRALAQ